MYGNWNNPHQYRQSQPNWPNEEWNDQINYNQEQPYYRQITIVEAMNIALAQVPGQVVKVELGTEKGVRVYEVDVVTAQGAKYEIAVDINTGEIVEIELD